MHSQGVVWAGEPRLLPAPGAAGLQRILHCSGQAWDSRGALGGQGATCPGIQLSWPMLSWHTDCKPSNVLLTDGWQAKVADLGTSRLLRGTSTAQSCATPAYAGERLGGAAGGWWSGVHRPGLCGGMRIWAMV